jgi:DNA-binding transcriptional ArsR family regulator
MDAPTTDRNGGEEIEPMMPDGVRGLFTEYTQSATAPEDSTSAFVELFVPRTRGKLLFALLGAGGTALTEKELVDRADVGRSAAHQHLLALADTPLVTTAGKKGNAQTYRIRHEHPTVQALRMASTVMRHGMTPQHVEEQFIGDLGAGVDPETGEERD